MALPSSGQVSFNDIQNEFGGSNPISLSEYYRGGSYTTTNNTNVPTGGAISVGNFYGAKRQLIPTTSMYTGSSATFTVGSRYGIYLYSSGTLNLPFASGADVLIVGGGGGGGSSQSGGGGAGGYKTQRMTLSGSLAATIGAGAAYNASGSASVFNGVTIAGGGKGGNNNGGGTSGASGGGAGSNSGCSYGNTTDATIGNRGGCANSGGIGCGGGGGGAGGVGLNGNSNGTPAPGGPGKQWLNGSYYGGGGGGGKGCDGASTGGTGGIGGGGNGSKCGAAGFPGTANTGGGGGGGGEGWNGGAGGSGIIAILFD